MARTPNRRGGAPPPVSWGVSRPSPRPIAPIPDPASDARTLRAFVAVARLGTVVRAADALGRTQPSVTARIAALERAWRTRLFRRQARGMILTPEGTRLLPLAEAALSSLLDLDRTAGLPMAGGHELAVGAGDALGRELLPRALARLVRKDPALSVRVLEGSAPRLLEALLDGEIDLALLVLPEAPPSRGVLRFEALFESDVDLLLPAGFARPHGRAWTVESLRGQRLVTLQPGSGFRRHVEASLAARGVPFRPAVVVGNLSLVRRFVAAGLGVAPVPAIAFASSGPGPAVERRRLRGIAPVGYHAAVRSGVPLSAGAERLLEQVLAAVAAREARKGAR